MFVSFLQLLLLLGSEAILDAFQFGWASEWPGSRRVFPQLRIGIARSAKVDVVEEAVVDVRNDLLPHTLV